MVDISMQELVLVNLRGGGPGQPVLGIGPGGQGGVRPAGVGGGGSVRGRGGGGVGGGQGLEQVQVYVWSC